MGCRATDVLPSPPRGATASGLLSARPARIRRRGQVRHPDAGHPTPGGLTVGLFPTVSTFEHHGDSAGVRDSGSAGHVATALPQIPGITRVRADCSTPQRTRGPGETWSRPASPPKNPRSRGNTPATSELHPNEAKPTQLDQTDQFEWVSMAVTVGFELTSSDLSVVCGAFLARVSAGADLSWMCSPAPDATRSFSRVYPRVCRHDPDRGWRPSAH